MRNFLIWAIGFVLSIIVMIYYALDSTGYGKNVYELSLIFLGIFISMAILSIQKNGKHFLLFFKTYFAPDRNKSLRVSFSYLFKISVKDKFGKQKFLLVRNTNMKNQLAFQPVGGVYKYFDKSFINSIKGKDAINFHQEGDLRLIIPKKNFSKILLWFNKNKDREVGNFREFYEELIKTKIVPSDNFPWINSRFLSRKNSGLRNSDFFQCEEIVFYDIFELIPTELQLKSFEKILNEKSEHFIWVDEEFIRRKGFDSQQNKDIYKICEHTIQIF